MDFLACRQQAIFLGRKLLSVMSQERQTYIKAATAKWGGGGTSPLFCFCLESLYLDWLIMFTRWGCMLVWAHFDVLAVNSPQWNEGPTGIACYTQDPECKQSAKFINSVYLIGTADALLNPLIPIC